MAETKDREEALEAVKGRYIRDASTKRYATSQDGNLRELEINAISKHLSDGLQVLDVGCGNGYSAISFANLYNSNFLGIDNSQNMIDAARNLVKDEANLKGKIEFNLGDVLNLKLKPESFDVIITERLLINLPTWEDQVNVIKSLHRLLKKEGKFLMMEATKQGVDRLNEIRKKVNLEPIPHSTKNNWWINRYDENKIEEFLSELFEIVEVQRFGLYFFISRVLYPLSILPEKPKFDSKLNEIARQVSLALGTDFNKLGHSTFFVLRKK